MKIVVGQGSCGIAAGALKVRDALKSEIDSKKLNIELDLAGCCGTCYLEPVVDFYDEDNNKTTFVSVSPDCVSEILDFAFNGKEPKNVNLINEEDLEVANSQKKIALRNAGYINPEKIEDYVDAEGYRALEKVLNEMSPGEVIDQIKISGLRGRGGAGFPTWFKWNAALTEKKTPKYLVCNADEGDPGAFMDRSILEGDPHCIIEGMLIAGYAIGASEGIVYVRAEYPLAVKRLETAIESAKKNKFLGENILDSDFSFDIRIKEGAGAFVCGEETALIASLEGQRGMPRIKPPYPSQKGYWSNPTNINNVETLANVPWIINNGGEAFAAMGTEKSKGTKVFALAGKIKKGGLVEVPMGLPISKVIYDIGGGILGDKEFKAVQTGGPSGGCIPASLADTLVDYESINATGAIMGSGGMVVMDEDTCMVEMARFFLDFTVNESCGKCIHCRIGTKRLLEILTRITEGNGKEDDLELLEDLSEKVIDGSLCALGGTAPNPVLTTLKYFRDEYEAHIYDKKCPAHRCTKLLTYSISLEKCKRCAICAKNCPTDAIEGSKTEPYVIDTGLCIQCGKCKTVCPFSAVIVD